MLINPRKIHLSKFASLDLQIKPGTYVALINGLINTILMKKMIDLKQMAELTANLSSLKEMVQKYTPDFVKNMTGISKENLHKTAEIYTKTKKALIVYSTGFTQQAAGIDNVKAMGNAKTPRGKGRAWIRVALIEKTLESYISALSRRRKLCEDYYETWALMRSEEQVDMVIALLASLSTVNFSLCLKDIDFDRLSSKLPPPEEVESNDLMQLQTGGHVAWYQGFHRLRGS